VDVFFIIDSPHEIKRHGSFFAVKENLPIYLISVLAMEIGLLNLY
jgi:hypothetical protein